MPNALTHSYIAEKILSALDAKTRATVEKYKNQYILGSLGPDIIMGLQLSEDEDKKIRASFCTLRKSTRGSSIRRNI
jgi:hypothetical protein